MISPNEISVRGVRVHNLKSVDLDLRRGRLFVFCGVSGSGKTSLALDTLYAEGQRRYIESFSAYTRQFLERLDKPDADAIEGIPPAIAVTRTQPSLSSRSTVGTATETVEYLRLLFSKIARARCPECNVAIRQDTTKSIADWLQTLPDGLRYMVASAPRRGDQAASGPAPEELQEQGFVRVRVGDAILNLADGGEVDEANWPEMEVVVDRLTAGQSPPKRIIETVETALRLGLGQCRIYVSAANAPEESLPQAGDPHAAPIEIDGRPWIPFGFSSTLACGKCGLELPEPQPRLFSFNSPLGACPCCEGFGSIFEPDMELIVPDPGKSLAEGAVATWTSKAYSRESQELTKIAADHNIRMNVAYRDLSDRERNLIQTGIPDTNFSGIDGFFAWLEKSAFKTHHRAFLSRWRSERMCPACHGTRLRSEVHCFTVNGKTIDEFCHQEIEKSLLQFREFEPVEDESIVAVDILQQIQSRLQFLDEVGLGYLTLDRPLRTLSGGEAQRVALTSALGSTLVNMLYILDEPTVGLHPEDVARLQDSVFELRNRGNTVVVVEHEPSMIEAADEVIEVGPGAGDGGGSIVYQGPPEELLESTESTTADFLTGRRGATLRQNRRPANRGRIRLTGARGNNLKNLTAEFPLGVLCLITGVSGAGKSTLVQDTLYGALCRRKRKDGVSTLEFDDVIGDGQIEEVVLVDQSPIGRTPRSNPVTYIKAFDDIRAVFADTLEARTRNLTASHFSFNVDGGRCTKCQGDGYLSIDMQFLADVYMRCPQCKGTRYRKEILDVTHRGQNIADVLDMTVRKAFSFFRGQTKLQAKLKRLIDVGLDYLKLGQPATTLSSGEAQRLKLASYTGTRKQQRTLFLLDEPTTGLHFSDIVKLIDCFDALLSVGHSIVVIEHNLQLMKAADYIIDLGPGASEAGGEIVCEGTPEEVAAHPTSITGKHLREALERSRHDD